VEQLDPEVELELSRLSRSAEYQLLSIDAGDLPRHLAGLGASELLVDAFERMDSDGRKETVDRIARRQSVSVGDAVLLPEHLLPGEEVVPAVHAGNFGFTRQNRVTRKRKPRSD
jgi:hypothetical protein